MEAVSNLTSHNARVAQIRKFVMKPPARATRLVLASVADTSTPEPLGEWLTEECRDNANVAGEISELVQDHSDNACRPIEAKLAWLDGAGTVITSKRLRARPQDESEDSLALGIDGSGTGQVVQMQRHMEAMTRSYLTAHQAQINSANQIAVHMSDRVLQLQNELDNLRSQLLENAVHQASMALAREIEAPPEETAGPETDQARAELIRTTLEGLKKAGPLVYAAAQTYFAQRASEAAQAAQAAQARRERTDHAEAAE